MLYSRTLQQNINRRLTRRAYGGNGNAITYLEILSWTRKGIQAEKENYRAMQEKAIEGQAHDIAGHCQEHIDALDVRLATIDEIEDIHNRK